MHQPALPAVGSIGPAADGIDDEFWAGLREGDLRIQRCAACQTWIWAPQWRCASCGGWELGWETVAQEGRIFSWTRCWHAFAPVLKDHLPYVAALVELPEAGNRRLLGMLVGPTDRLRIGADVRGVIQAASDLTNDQPVLRWRLVE
jgi:uncharacterized protein